MLVFENKVLYKNIKGGFAQVEDELGFHKSKKI